MGISEVVRYGIVMGTITGLAPGPVVGNRVVEVSQTNLEIRRPRVSRTIKIWPEVNHAWLIRNICD